ncbi:molecular chaperone DnaJ [Methylopila capsulata]|uniref:Chaperone protein DnaJ n=1 Tax=Methylopila capsulata TaxID=61654 RepID=A0A9W6IWV6_9HYPH|nr:molecular chaperone DnaJ [Methylopila capsulata]MBM7852901.1 molecular chaperone DnaJ [Methylopila capsulata]GLK57112.1 chaperone protein DnaJ [Methylopila capsulata]
MAKRDFYEVLEVERTASDAELKVAYRKAAMRWHPDRNPGDQAAEANFKEINAAYDCLKDADKRAAYDRFGHAAFEQGGMGGGGPRGAGPDMSDFMSDIFDSFFGGGGGQGRGRSSSGRERGADLRYNMEITLEDAFAGKTAQIRIPTSLACEACSGTGAKPGSKPRQCATCGGAGKVRASQGFFLMERTCPTCQGRGEVIDDPCDACGGAGRITKERTLEVAIPAGVEDGTRIRLSGEGEAGLRGGPSGDLYIFLSLEDHALFQRDGADLYCRVPIAMTTAALGGSFEAPTIDGGRTRVKIPEGTQSGMQFRLRGKGMPILRSKDFGDMYIQAVVEIPQKLSRKQRELLEAFAAEESEANHPESTGFFSRVKEFFGGA